jgi:hypothetical protein
MDKNRFIEEENLEQELLASFEVEELEKRYEMGWLSGGEVSASVDSNGVAKVELKFNIF